MGLWMKFAKARSHLHRRAEWAPTVFARAHSTTERGVRRAEFVVRPCTVLFMPTWGGPCYAVELAFIGWRTRVRRIRIDHKDARVLPFGADRPPVSWSRRAPRQHIEIFCVTPRFRLWALLTFFCGWVCHCKYPAYRGHEMLEIQPSTLESKLNDIQTQRTRGPYSGAFCDRTWRWNVIYKKIPLFPWTARWVTFAPLFGGLYHSLVSRVWVAVR